MKGIGHPAIREKIFWALYLIVCRELDWSNVKQHTELLKLSNKQLLKLFFKKKSLCGEDTVKSFNRVKSNFTLSL